MSKVSKREKADKLKSIFSEKKEFFNYKELEKLAKQKSIPGTQVKELLEDLIDRDLIKSDKIGGSIYYWVAADKPKENKQETVDKLEMTMKTLDSELLVCQGELVEYEVIDFLLLLKSSN